MHINRVKHLSLLATAAGLLVTSPVYSASVLAEFGLFVDDTSWCTGGCDVDVAPDGAGLPTGVDASGFDFGNGTGAVSVRVQGAGIHTVDFFVDHDIDAASNTFFNEYGATGGVPAAGQLWEIDEPGFIFGDLFANFLAGMPDNTNGVPSGTPDDVAMMLGWSLSLTANEVAHIEFLVSAVAPAGGFFLSHTDPDSAQTLYFSSDLSIVPIPGALVLFAGALCALVGFRERRG